jgi:isovaleryl-CoA dehydrogenase
MDFLGVAIPEEYGGAGLGLVEHAIITEQISYASAPIGLSYLADTALTMNRIAAFGTPSQKETYLPRLISGEHVGALAMSESEAGSDVMSMKLDAKACYGGYVLNGSKLWITNGARRDGKIEVTADVAVVYAKTDQKAGSKGVTGFIVEGGTQGFKPGQKIEKDSMRGSNTYEILFDECFVPDSQVLGEENKGSKVLMSGLNDERVILAAASIGLAQAALDQTIAYGIERKQFKMPIIFNQSSAFHVADMASELNAARALTYIAAAAGDRGKLTNGLAASAFLQASKIATRTTMENIYHHGGVGLTHEFDASRFARNAHLFRIGGGSEGIRRLIIANEIIPGYAEFLKQEQAFRAQLH